MELPQLRERLGRALAEQRAFAELEIEGDFQHIGHKIFLLDGRCIDPGEGKPKMLLVALTDATSQKLAEREMQTAHSALKQNLQHAESSLRESAADLLQSRENCGRWRPVCSPRRRRAAPRLQGAA